jgi:DNA-dependent protein kinase catalytic subunit
MLFYVTYRFINYFLTHGLSRSDPLLPRIAELAQSASDRQTKVAACEFIHATILYMVGWNAKRGDLKPYAKLYEKLFPAAIRLATDVEQITRQLFEPLVFQLIHWFTKNLTQENEDTMALLDAIVEAVGDESDGSLRDFAAKCLSEFLKWSIKQTTEKQQEKNPFNAKSLFKRLYSLANHPNPYRRLGCAFDEFYYYKFV